MCQGLIAIYECMKNESLEGDKQLREKENLIGPEDTR